MIYSASFSTIFYSASTSLYTNLANIVIPDRYLLTVLDPENPELRMPYIIPNDGIYDYTEFILNVSMDLQYIDKINDSEINLHVFSKEINFNIAPMHVLTDIFRGDIDDFDTEALEFYQNTVNDTILTRFMLDFIFKGKYCNGVISFYISIKNYEFGEESECPMCG